jgi:hypothetical protein
MHPGNYQSIKKKLLLSDGRRRGKIRLAFSGDHYGHEMIRSIRRLEGSQQ